MRYELNSCQRTFCLGYNDYLLKFYVVAAVSRASFTRMARWLRASCT